MGNMTRRETLSFRELPLVSPEFIHFRKGILGELINSRGGGGVISEGVYNLNRTSVSVKIGYGSADQNAVYYYYYYYYYY